MERLKMLRSKRRGAGGIEEDRGTGECGREGGCSEGIERP